MAAQLLLTVRTNEGETQRTFPRLPVFVGRKVPAGHCSLDDRSASKLHATLDLRQGLLCLHDAASTNGTFVAGQRIPANTWVALGPMGQPAQFSIGSTTLVAQAIEEAAPSSIRAETLSGLIEGIERPDSRVETRPRASASAPFSGVPSTLEAPPFGVHHAETSAGGRLAGEAVERLAPACQDAVSSMGTLRRLLTNAVESTRAEDRASVCHELARSFPQLLEDGVLRDLFAEHGVQSDVANASGAAAATALASLKSLATYYTGRAAASLDASAVSAFALRLRTTLDDFLLGYTPLVSGLNKFEDEMAIRGPRSAGDDPASAAQVAGELLDWTLDDAEPRARLRSSFAELTMHQVALLRGVMRGVKTLLQELSPAVIEESIEREAAPRGALGRMFARPDPWTAYKRRHADLSDEENERFRLLFGVEFVSEYRQFTREGHAGDADPDPDR